MDSIEKSIEKARRRREKEINNLRLDIFKTQTPLSKCVYTRGTPIYLRYVHVAGKLLNYKVIDDDLTAILYMDSNFNVKHEVISTQAFKIYLDGNNKSLFFDIKYEVYGPDFNHDCSYEVVHHPVESEPFWYKNQQFRELIEVEFSNDPTKKAEALEIAEEHEKSTANLD